MTTHESMTAAGQPLWIKGCSPKAGQLARVHLRSTADIAAVEAIAPELLLPGISIYDCIRASAARTPDKAAIIHLASADAADAPRVISYRELIDSIEKAARLFRAISGSERASVSIILPMLPEALIAAWGGATSGISNPINPYLETRQIASIMNAAKTTVLVTTTRQYGAGAWDRLDEIKSLVPTLKRVLIVNGDDTANDFAKAVAAQEPGLGFEPPSEPHAEAVYLPTGGTTAAPKLVRMTHRGQLLAAWIMGALADPSPEGVVGHAMPNFHVGGGVILSLRAILYGQTLLTLTTDGFRSQAVVRNFWDIARRHRVSSLIATPATAAAILALPDSSSEGHCIKSFNAGGSTIPVELLRAFHARFGIWLRELWGMSEIQGAVSGHLDDGTEPVAGSVGRCLPWHPVMAIEVDADNNLVRICEPGERGVLVIGGPNVTPGYADPSLDDEFFVKGMPGTLRWANTGDLGTVDANGFIWLFGRAKDVIIRGGHNIDPKMIEEVLVCHPAVQIAAAVGRPDSSKGEMPIAYVQFKEGHSASREELLALCKDKVQERAAVPIDIIALAQIPMTAVGKINKPALRLLTMRQIASEESTKIIDGCGHCEVSIDETGKRPAVQIKVQVAADRLGDIESKLKHRFRDYEFLTVIEMTAAA